MQAYYEFYLRKKFGLEQNLAKLAKPILGYSVHHRMQDNN